ncbi:SdpI family protein [Pontibacter beigongshangensis]|uniref:SdpI family protein n=1 Tax=Pontibacter beigongshangensis TaxID=2574733 RepID=UPI001650CA71|nr:SdpI family protein [Pontibacter beigongshangensis]
MKKVNLRTEFFLWLVMLVPFVYLWLSWQELPARVPIHFNLQGEADGWADKSILIGLLLFITVGLYLLLLLLPKIDPKRKIEHTSPVYARIRVVLVLFMAALGVYSIYSASGQQAVNLNLILISIGVLVAALGNYLQSLKPNYFIGIRTPWTLESETVWRKTHRLSGPIWFAGGLLIALLALVDDSMVRQVLLIAIIAILVLVPVTYSYMESKKEKKLNSQA